MIAIAACQNTRCPSSLKTINMKQLFSLFITGLLGSACMAQVTEGKVIYERTSEVTSFSRMGGSSEVETKVNKDVSTYQLLFNNKHALLEVLPDMNQMANDDNNRVIRIGASQGRVFTDLENSRTLTESELAGSSYLVEGEPRTLNWKLTAESKTILGYKTQKAVGKDYVVSRVPTMENGVMKMVERGDSVEVVAWYTTAIPVQAGPDFPSQLPGLILELKLENGKEVYTATEVSKKYNAAALKAPTKGKRITESDFEKEMAKVRESMNDMLKERGRNRRS